MTRAQVVYEARRWVGVQWHHQGRTKHGVDCIGLVVCVARAFKLPVEDRTDYARVPTGTDLLDHLYKHLTMVKPTGNLVGYVGVFREQRLACHVGIITSKNGVTHVVHAKAGQRKVVEEAWSLNQPKQLQLVAVGKFPGLED